MQVTKTKDQSTLRYFVVSFCITAWVPETFHVRFPVLIQSWPSPRSGAHVNCLYTGVVRDLLHDHKSLSRTSREKHALK